MSKPCRTKKGRFTHAGRCKKKTGGRKAARRSAPKTTARRSSRKTGKAGSRISKGVCRTRRGIFHTC